MKIRNKSPHIKKRLIPLNLTFIGPCIVIYFYSKTKQMHQFLKFILFWNKPELASQLHLVPLASR
jgi:hypothetical protein